MYELNISKDNLTYPVAEGFKFREKLQEIYENILKGNREKPGTWNNNKGDYSIPIYSLFNDFTYLLAENNTTKEKRLPIQTLQGIELNLNESLLRIEKNLPSGKPLIVLDIGGGVPNLSLLRLAYASRREVEAGQRIFISTSLSDRSEWALHDLTPEEIKFVQKASSNVTYLYGNIAELLKERIILPSGENYQLKANVDLLMEFFSVSMWSMVPERDISMMMLLLSDFGQYFCGDTQPADFIMFPPGTLEETKIKMKEVTLQRKLALRQVHDFIEEYFSLKKVMIVEEGPKKGWNQLFPIFRKSKSPLIYFS